MLELCDNINKTRKLHSVKPIPYPITVSQKKTCKQQRPYWLQDCDNSNFTIKHYLHHL